ncbi:TolC family protein [bacterium]|jgi:outer membrane protein TolC|nr:TolC family protein [bacterium]MBT7311329.1 TolC family protein [bacterium]
MQFKLLLSVVVFLLLSITVDAAALDQLGTVSNDTLFVSRENVVVSALKHNEMLSASSSMVDAANADALGAWRGFLPRVSLGGYQMRSNDALYGFGFKLNQRRATPADMSTPPYGTTLNFPGITENNISQVKLLMPVFNGGMAVYGKKAANNMALSAKMDHKRAEETVEYHAVQAYEGLLLASAYETVMLVALKAADGHVRQAQAMFDAEMVTESDLLQAKVYRSGLHQKLIETRNMVRTSGEYIKLLTASDVDLIIAPANSDKIEVARLAFGTTGATTRSDIESGKLKSTAAGNMVKVARGSMLPHLNMSAEKNWYSSEDFLGDDSDAWTVGVYASWDIFSGLENIGALKKARAQSRATNYMLDFETRKATVEATQAKLELEAAIEKYSVAGEAVTAAREGLRIVTNQYREGLASMVDLLDVQAASTMAEGNLVQAGFDVSTGVAKLRFAGGTVYCTGSETE